MKREAILRRLGFQSPDIKKKRVIIHTDLAAEADDQYAVAHHLMTPTEDVVCIIAANFEWRFRTFPALGERLKSMEKSYAEAKKILALMEIDDVPIFHGAPDKITGREDLPESEGSAFIIREALKDCEEPLYIALQGTLTDLAVAYLTEPKIAEKIEAAIWIGGGAYPHGGQESNLQQDIYAAQILFDSPVKIWQIPVNVYGGAYLSFAEIVSKVKPCGKIGHYLCEVMFAVNDWYGNIPRRIPFPHGEVWSIGDQPTVSVLLQSPSGSKFHIEKAPHIQDNMTYLPNPQGKDIVVYDGIDNRLTMDDFFAKLALCYGESAHHNHTGDTK